MWCKREDPDLPLTQVTGEAPYKVRYEGSRDDDAQILPAAETPEYLKLKT